MTTTKLAMGVAALIVATWIVLAMTSHPQAPPTREECVARAEAHMRADTTHSAAVLLSAGEQYVKLCLAGGR